MTAYDEALIRWSVSDAGQDCADVYSLGSGRVDHMAVRRRLVARLDAAFAAAWDAHQAISEKIIDEHRSEVKEIFETNKKDESEWTRGPEPMLDRP